MFFPVCLLEKTPTIQLKKDLVLHGAGLADVDTIEELTDILASGDLGGVVDHSRGLGDLFDVVAGEDDLILDLGGAVDLDPREHLDDALELLAKEVVDVDLLLVIGNEAVDGEVSIDKAHLVLVALGDAGDHVLDVSGDGADRGDGLAGSEPHLEVHLFVLGADEVHVEVADVLEAADEGATGASDLDLLGAHLNGDAFGDGDLFNDAEDLHFLLVRGVWYFFSLLEKK